MGHIRLKRLPATRIGGKLSGFYWPVLRWSRWRSRVLMPPKRRFIAQDAILCSPTASGC